MSRKLSRLVLVAAVATGFGLLPMLGADAVEPRTSSVDAHAETFVVPNADISNRLDINIGDSVRWYIIEGTHTVTPLNQKQWGQDGSEDLTPEDPPEKQYVASKFKTAANYTYYCKHHGGIDGEGKPYGMWGFIHVTDPNVSPPPPPPSSETTTTTAAPTTTTRPPTATTTPPSVGGAGVHTPITAAPAPTTTTGAEDKNKNKKSKDAETTTTTTAPPPPPAPIDLPDSAIIPSLPGSEVPASVQEGVVGEALGEAPEGQAVALLRSEKRRGGGGMKLLIASGIGLGALGLGTAGYKFANRSSRYFPA